MSKLNPNSKSKREMATVVKASQPAVKGSALTENGALAFDTTGNILVDFFARFGAMRNSSEFEILNTFYAAHSVAPMLTTKLFVYFRDCRGGQGERRAFDVVYNDLIGRNDQLAYDLLQYVPEFGSWKDVKDLMVMAHNARNRTFFDFACSVYVEQLAKDATSKTPSLAAKYAPSENWARKNKIQGEVFKRYMRFANEILDLDTPGAYRRLLTELRAKLDVVEVKMSANKWSKIQFATVPSKAHAIYRKAFGKHEPARYAEYLAKVKKGEAKINASVLTPVDVVQKYIGSSYDETLEQLWNALPNYVNHDVLTICDVSGSMTSSVYSSVPPIVMSVALGIYFAQRSKGVCKNELVTFTDIPTFFDISEATSLYEAIQMVKSMRWDMNTNFTAVFDMLLQAAKENKATQEDLPKFILCVSDMQFDSAESEDTPFDSIKRKFKAAGYEMPQMVFWNVDARDNKSFPTFDQQGVMQVSGNSPAIMQFVLSTLANDSLAVVRRVLENERYAFVEKLECFR